MLNLLRKSAQNASFNSRVLGGSVNHTIAKNFCFDVKKLRNIGISAHIDSGKTTFTERILYYSGKIHSIHDVKGTDGVGATMDFMELEKERGITIQSAATTVQWKENQINIIDTPGHVDFTIEVERALRVLDGAVMLLCGVSGVQAQTLTVDKQMNRYKVPRICFINKMDRMGAEPWHVVNSIRERLGINAAAIQIPIGSDEGFTGVVDLINMNGIIFEDEIGEKFSIVEIPNELKKIAKEKRAELVACLAEVDEEMEMLYLEEKDPSPEELADSIERGVKSLKFSPVMMGSAYKNKGVQQALDAVARYLPSPLEARNKAFRMNKQTGQEEEFDMELDPKKPFIGLSFKLEEGQFGQLTYVRAYQGRLKKGQVLMNKRDGSKFKVSRMAKMHANQMEDISQVEAGDIFALFGIECSSGDTLTAENLEEQISLSSMHVPDPVISLRIIPKNKKNLDKLQKAMNKFKREDPTFHVNIDEESEEIIISGMGELHLEVYAERLKREFEIPCDLGEPTVNYRETLTGRVDFNYLHKKQSGGAGQYAKVIGYMEPITDADEDFGNLYEDKTIGTSIPNEFKSAIENQFHESCVKGPLTNYPVVKTKYVLTDGDTHVVDSSSAAFAVATRNSIRECFENDGGCLLEPVMKLEVNCPISMYQGVMQDVTKRGGNIYNSEPKGDVFVIEADVALSKMFGFASKLRGMTQGQGEFSMEYKTHAAVPTEDFNQIVAKIRKEKEIN